MDRRLGFVISGIGIMFVLLPLGKLFQTPDFVTVVGGFVFLIVGIFFAIESIAKHIAPKK